MRLGAPTVRRPVRAPRRVAVAVLTPDRRSAAPSTHALVPPPPPLPTDAPSLAVEIARNLEFGVGAAPGDPLSSRAAYRAVAASVRDRVIERRNATQAHWE